MIRVLPPWPSPIPCVLFHRYQGTHRASNSWVEISSPCVRKCTRQNHQHVPRGASCRNWAGAMPQGASLWIWIWKFCHQPRPAKGCRKRLLYHRLSIDISIAVKHALFTHSELTREKPWPSQGKNPCHHFFLDSSISPEGLPGYPHLQIFANIIIRLRLGVKINLRFVKFPLKLPWNHHPLPCHGWPCNFPHQLQKKPGKSAMRPTPYRLVMCNYSKSVHRNSWLTSSTWRSSVFMFLNVCSIFTSRYRITRSTICGKLLLWASWANAGSAAHRWHQISRDGLPSPAAALGQ